MSFDTNVTEIWPQNGMLSLKPSGWTDTRAFQVVRVANQRGAINAVGIKPGDPHNLSPLLFAGEARIGERQGPNAWIVNVPYGVTRKLAPEDPLNMPIRWFPQITTRTLPVDVDPYGNPILNSAGDAFDPPATREFVSICLRATQNEPFYDIRKALAFSVHWNSDAVVVPLGGTVQPGQMFCHTVSPEREYTEDETFVPVVYTFEILQGLKFFGGVSDAFKLRLLDQGRRALFKNSAGILKAGNIYFAATGDQLGGDQIATDIRLNGKGVPVDAASYKIGPTFDSAVAGSPSSQYISRKTIVDTGKYATWLIYDNALPAVFASIGTF